MNPVQDQYENFPYPFRDPKDEDKRLVTGSPSTRDEINHFLYAGARDWSQPFRALIAGGGTGDALIMLAQELADVGCPAEIVYLDLSEASRAVAEARAARRSLKSITFVTGSLLDAADHGRFDYIDCCGVLHHLPDPIAGFQALRKALRPAGGMGVMVYGELGRSGVYDAQAMLRKLTKEGDSGTQRVEIAKRLLAGLPDSNRLKRNPFVKDHLANDAGLFDLLLHGQDRAYRVPELYEAMDQSDLDMVGFVGPANYDPDYLITDAKLKARLTQLNPSERAGFAELLTGNIKKHIFYCAPKGSNDTARIAQVGETMIPVPHQIDFQQFIPSIRAGKPLVGRREGLKVEFPLPMHAAEILSLCDGTRTFGQMRQEMTGTPSLDAFLDEARQVYRAFHGLNLMLLKKGA